MNNDEHEDIFNYEHISPKMTIGKTQAYSKEAISLADDYADDINIFQECLVTAVDNFSGDDMQDELKEMMDAYGNYSLDDLGGLFYNEIQNVSLRRAEAEL